MSVKKVFEDNVDSKIVVSIVLAAVVSAGLFYAMRMSGVKALKGIAK